MADLNGESLVSMNVSLAGLSVFQSGAASGSVTRTTSGFPAIRGWENPAFAATRAAAESFLDEEYQNAFKSSFASSKKKAIQASAEYAFALASADPLTTGFTSTNYLST